ncbi:MAG: hypothetical protein ACTSX0_13435 [Promethearchaeota archaeon]
MEAIHPSDLEESQLQPIFIQKISPLNKELHFQYLVFSLASVASFLLVYYLTYQDYIVDLIRNNILPRNLDWMLYVSAGLIVICLVICLFAPLSERFFKVQEILQKEPRILHEVEQLLDSFEFSEARQLIETYLEERYQFSLKKNLNEILNFLRIAQTGELLRDYILFIEKLFEEGKKFELKRELDQIYNILFTKSDLHPKLAEKLEFLKDKIENIQF